MEKKVLQHQYVKNFNKSRKAQNVELVMNQWWEVGLIVYDYMET